MDEAQTDAGAVMVQLGKPLMVTSVFPLHWHPFPSVTMTVTCAGELVPAVHVICLVLFPPVIVPFVTFQLYVAPTPASGTEAVLPVDPAHTAAGAVITQLGSGLCVTSTLPLH